MLLLLESIFLLPYDKTKAKFPYKYVDLAKQKMISYAWGKESFKLLINSVKSVSDEPFAKGKYDLKGFPMALHLWLLASVPKLESSFARFENSSNEFICARYLSIDLPYFKPTGKIENSENVEVTCVLRSVNNAADLLVDEHNDDLDSVMRLVIRGYRLTQCDWDLKLFELEKAEEIISQQNLRFRATDNQENGRRNR